MKKWTGFFAGVTVVFNALALTVLVFPLGLQAEAIRWIAAGVLAVDMVIEIVLFVRS